MRKFFKCILILTIFAIAGLIFVASHKPKTVQAYTNGALLKAINDPNVYVIQSSEKGELKVLIRSISVFNSCGYNWANVQNVANINYLPRTANLIKKVDNPDVYRLEKNFKRKFRSAAVLDSYSLHWEDIATVCPAVLDSYSTAPLLADGTMIYKVGSDFVRHAYNNMATFYADGMSTKDIIDVNDSEIYSYDSGVSMPAVAITNCIAEEGGLISQNQTCCTGLSPIAHTMVGNDNLCYSTPYNTEIVGICSKCGDGFCDNRKLEGENGCNCPTDCK